ncbi:hypothetical protein AY599_09860 [Leptolyngbya valderiana BDU 20041]|nr:hypothetical protein AY599_09860 [Leptolyngbya valderiana BDU 20041]
MFDAIDNGARQAMERTIQALLNLPQLEYFVIDRDRTIREISVGVLRFGDLPEEVQIGRDARSPFPELVGLEEVLDDLLERRRTSFILKGIARFADDTSMFYIDLYFLPKILASETRNGQIIVLVRDSTERMATEQEFGQIAKEYSMTLIALESAKNYIDRVFHAMKDALFVVTATGRIVTINNAAKDLFGYEESALLLQPITKIVLDERLSQAIETRKKLPETGVSGEFRCRTQPGEIRQFEFSCATLQQEDTIDAFVCIGRDITQRKRLEVQLQQQSQRDRLLGHMMQRIRQSLSLAEILNTTVDEVQQCMGYDRALVVRVENGRSLCGCVEAVASGYESMLTGDRDLQAGQDRCLVGGTGELTLDVPMAIADVASSERLDESCRQILQQAKVRSQLVVPIFSNVQTSVLDRGEVSNASIQLWGLLAVQVCRDARLWEEWEIELLQRLSEQVSIAIEQAQLYGQLQAANRKLEQLASLDELTQLFNRRHFNEVFDREWRRMARERQPLSLILCDIDEFKKYNDAYGHVAGDACLEQVAEVLREGLRRGGDLAARYGGEEFAIILPNTELSGAVDVVQSIRDRLAARNLPHPASQVTASVTLSVGIASWVPSASSSAEELLKAADWALYQAKVRGRDRYCIYPHRKWRTPTERS